MIHISIEQQTFYDISLNYSELPSDLIEVTSEQHLGLLNAINSGCVVFSDLTVSPPRPDQFHTWNGSGWVDPRTEAEKLEYKRANYPALTRYQFKRCLLENGFKTSEIEAKILEIDDELTRELVLLGFKEAGTFIRTDESILTMQKILGLSGEQVDTLWEYALTL